MKFSTRARYGLRMMVELTRALSQQEPVQLGKIAGITGLSENYLAQLAMSLKNDGLLIGISGKRGGYQLARPAAEITVGEIVKAVIGPISLTECVSKPNICLNSSFCEARSVWAIVNSQVQQALESISLADLVDKGWLARVQSEHDEITYLFPDRMMAESGDEMAPGCPLSGGSGSSNE